jgi:hypothetical protein
MKKDEQKKETAQTVKKRLPVLFEAFLMAFVPVIGFILFSFILYPLQPHCSLGNGALGCTPMCEATSYFENGQPSSYKTTPCFHDQPSSFQTFSYKQPIPYYLIFLFPIAIGFLLLGPEKFYNSVLKILFYPYFLFKRNRENKNFISRFITIILFLPITIEWLIGYGILITTILGINLFS